MFPPEPKNPRVGPVQTGLRKGIQRGLQALLVTAMVIGIMPHGVSASSPDVAFSSKTIGQGDLCLIQVRVEKGEVPHVTWRKRKIYLVPNGEKTLWYGLLGADLKAQKGDFKVVVNVRPEGTEGHFNMEILERPYGVRRLTLPKKMVDLDKKTLERARRESRAMKALWKATPTAPLWRGGFIRPVPGVAVGPFGRSSIINNQPRAPHSGVDLRGERGTPVAATNHGKVVLTGDHFFTGLTVVIDHGGGIQSMYFHLDKILVNKGDMVDKGQVIGQVGSTGRSSGPHLHWGIRLNGDRVDPLRLTEISKVVDETMPDSEARAAGKE